MSGLASQSSYPFKTMSTLSSSAPHARVSPMLFDKTKLLRISVSRLVQIRDHWHDGHKHIRSCPAALREEPWGRGRHGGSGRNGQRHPPLQPTIAVLWHLERARHPTHESDRCWRRGPHCLYQPLSHPLSINVLSHFDNIGETAFPAMNHPAIEAELLPRRG